MRLSRIAVLPLALAVALAAAARDEPPTKTSDRRVATTTDEEVVRIPATRARISAAVETTADTSSAAQEQTRTRAQAVLEFLRQAAVERLQAGTISLYPVYAAERRPPEEPGSGPKVTGYRAQWSASFEVDAEAAGRIADGLVKAGVDRIGDFEFTASDEAIAEARQQALQRAAVQARKDAQALIAGLGYTPGDVVRIDAHPGGPVRPLMRREMMAFSADQGPATPVQPGMVDVNASVTLEVEY